MEEKVDEVSEKEKELQNINDENKKLETDKVFQKEKELELVKKEQEELEKQNKLKELDKEIEAAKEKNKLLMENINNTGPSTPVNKDGKMSQQEILEELTAEMNKYKK
jgi:phenylalanyl-tRNA synthetase alpha subunit